MSYEYKPLEGLLNIKEAPSGNLFDLLNYVEEKVPSLPKGRSKKLLLFLIIINLLKKNGLSFYVKGGIILQYFLGEHARETDDIDVVIPGDSDVFYEQIKKVLAKPHKGLSFAVEQYNKRDADANYYYDSFNMTIKVYHEDELIEEVNFEGVRGSLFDEIEPETYQGPEVVEPGFTFLGVPVEYVFAEKILAITSELKRPIKHLVDAYSLASVAIDLEKLMKYLNVILSYEKPVRESAGISVSRYEYVVREDKEYIGGYFFAALSAGHTISQKEMTDSLNKWMKKIG